MKDKKNNRVNQRPQNQNNRKTFFNNGKGQNLLSVQAPDTRDCDYYTNNLCLKVSNYPKQEIIALLSGRNRRVGNDLIADVLDQSADQLIDGVTSAQENAYTFSHYYGAAERREGTNITYFAEIETIPKFEAVCVFRILTHSNFDFLKV